MLSRSKAQGHKLSWIETCALVCPLQGLLRPNTSLMANIPTGVRRRTQSNVEEESVAEPASPGQHSDAAAERSPPSSAEKQPEEAPLEGMQPSISLDSLTQEEEEHSDAAKLAGDLQKVRI